MSIHQERVRRSNNPKVNAMSAARRLAKQASTNRLVLSGKERQMLAEAYRLIDRIVERHGLLEGEGGDG